MSQAEALRPSVLGLAISTTLISYIGTFPALAVLRRRFPNGARPSNAPLPVGISILLTVLIVARCCGA